MASVNKVFKYSGMMGDTSFVLGAFCFEESENASEKMRSNIFHSEAKKGK